MNRSSYDMINVTWGGRPPVLADIAKRYEIPEDAFDPTFGVIAVSPAEGVYTVRIAPEWSSKVSGEAGATGPFPEGRIESFGIDAKKV